MWASVVAQGLISCGSTALEQKFCSSVHRISCSAACRIFPDHWQADSYPLRTREILDRDINRRV